MMTFQVGGKIGQKDQVVNIPEFNVLVSNSSKYFK